MEEFILKSKYKPAGDQQQAIDSLSQGIKDGLKSQVLLGVTGMLGLLHCHMGFFVEDHWIGFFSEVPFILDDPFESCLVPTDDFGHIFDLFLIEPSRYGEEGLSVEVRLTDPLDDLALLGM